VSETVLATRGDLPITNFWIPTSTTVDSNRLVTTRARRGFADGAVSILLPSYLTVLGLGAT